MVIRHLTVLDAADERADHFDPLISEIDQERDCGADVQSHEKCKPCFVLLVDPPMQQFRQHHRVAQAANREQLGDALEDAEKDCLEEIHRASDLDF